MWTLIDVLNKYQIFSLISFIPCFINLFWNICILCLINLICWCSCICNLEFHSFLQTAWQITCTLQNQKEVLFDLPHPPTPETGPLQSFPHPQVRRAGCAPGVAREGDGNRSNCPCITCLWYVAQLWVKHVIIKLLKCIEIVLTGSCQLTHA